MSNRAITSKCQDPSNVPIARCGIAWKPWLLQTGIRRTEKEIAAWNDDVLRYSLTHDPTGALHATPKRVKYLTAACVMHGLEPLTTPLLERLELDARRGFETKRTLGQRAAAGMKKTLHITTRSQWRTWLAEHHDQEPSGVWLVFNKKATGEPSIAYEEAVEEALCFGWIDSIIKRISDDQYCRMFTPRKDRSQWSNANQARVAKLIREGRMTEFGLAKIKAAKRLGNWRKDPRSSISREIPQELSAALARNRKAREFFATLAPTCRRHFAVWIASAKRPETRAKRLKESLALLGRRETLGLK